ncbi:hypothetical protein SAMN05444161_8695 [Rhizobiales bacterium GAS191]|nr:hypothetical protein SAMN05444161_8695 [Rhizobiales bacterium GAS191]
MREISDQLLGQTVSLCEPVERRILVEATHMDGPFNSRAFATKLEPRPGTSDRDKAEIDAGCIVAVDFELTLAGELAQ